LVRLRSSIWDEKEDTQPAAAIVTTLPENPAALRPQDRSSHGSADSIETDVRHKPPPNSPRRRPPETKTSPELSPGKVGSEDRHPSASHRRHTVAHPDEGHETEEPSCQPLPAPSKEQYGDADDAGTGQPTPGTPPDPSPARPRRPSPATTSPAEAATMPPQLLRPSTEPTMARRSRASSSSRPPMWPPPPPRSGAGKPPPRERPCRRHPRAAQSSGGLLRRRRCERRRGGWVVMAARVCHPSRQRGRRGGLFSRLIVIHQSLYA
jgi:hypothetical protein